MATRQTLIFKDEYNSYEFIKEMNKLWNVFADEEIEINSKDIIFYEASKHIIHSMEDGLGKTYTYHFMPNPRSLPSITNDKFILCCISGGKDSLAMTLHYKQLGYDVYLYTVKGINRGYPEEHKAAIKLAQELKLPLIIDEIKMKGKKFYMEHPLKNQIIASMAIAYCLEHNYPPNVAFGNYQESINVRGHWGVNWTDKIRTWNHYNAFIKEFIPNAFVDIPFHKEDEALSILNDNFELVPLYQSCLITVRNRGQLKKHNEEKYGVQLMPNRCGSCRKCCAEYVYFCDMGKLEYNEKYYKHCLDILKKKWFELTAEDRKFKDLKEVHEAYFGNIKSKYFEK